MDGIKVAVTIVSKHFWDPSPPGRMLDHFVTIPIFGGLLPLQGGWLGYMVSIRGLYSSL